VTTDRQQQSTNGRVYVEGTVVHEREDIGRKRRRPNALVPIVIAIVIGTLVVRRVLRGAAA
jgi:hypothetical protein